MPCEYDSRMGLLLTAVDSDMEAARAALLSGDYATALDYATAAQGRLAIIPSTETARNRVLFERKADSIQAFITNVRRRQGAAQGVQTSKITYARPTS